MKKLLVLAAATLAFAANLTDNSVVAKVDGKKITVKDVNYYLQGITGDSNAKLQNLPKSYYPQIIGPYIDTQVFYKYAKKVEKDPRFKELEKKVAVTYWIAEKLKNIKVTQKEAKEFYNTYKDFYFKRPESFKVRHILVKDKATAEKIINELKGLKGKALEKKFAQLAKKYSVGPTSVNGGELGWVNEKNTVKPFIEACKELKVGEITTKPVKTRFGYHVILLEAKKKAGYVPFNQVAPKIVKSLKQQKLEAYLKSLRDKANVKIYLK